MKHILLIAAISFAAGAQAQKLELGGNFGIAKNFDANAGGSQLYYSAKGIYNVCSGFQVGLSGSITQLPFEMVSKADELNSAHVLPGIDLYSPGTQTVHNLKAIANVKRNVGFGALTVYSGLSAGIMNAMGSQNHSPNTLTKGYSVGAQAGATYNVTKRFGINAELAADYINMKANGADYGREAGKNNLTTINMPLAIGFRYKLSCPCPKKCPMSKEAKATD